MIPVMEKRTMERFDLKLPGQIRFIRDSNEETIDLLTSNVCSEGAFFSTEKPLPIDTRVNIDLVLPLNRLKKREGKRSLIKSSGKVVRTDQKGMAICFDEKCKISPLSEAKTNHEEEFILN